jgi:hypothetical protein
LKRREEEIVKQQSRDISLNSLTLEAPVVEVSELAEKYNVLENSVKVALNGKRFTGYKRIGDMFIKKELLEEIQARLEEQIKQRELTLSQATKIIEDVGGRSPVGILNLLGYKVMWHGINPESTKIQRIIKTYEER